MSDSLSASSPWRGRTLWARDRSAPLREFLRTESGSAGVLVAAVVAALIWANVDSSSYESVWRTQLSIRLGRSRPVPGPADLGQQRPDDACSSWSSGWRRAASSTWANCATDAASSCRWWPGWSAWPSRS